MLILVVYLCRRRARRNRTIAEDLSLREETARLLLQRCKATPRTAAFRLNLGLRTRHLGNITTSLRSRHSRYSTITSNSIHGNTSSNHTNSQHLRIGSQMDAE